MKWLLKDWWGIVLFLIILYASYLLVLLSLPYIHFKPNIDFLRTKQLIYHIDIWRWSFYIHVFTSPLVIISGLLQFNRYLLQKRMIHRILGYIYVLTVLAVTGPAAFIMSLYANGSYPAQISFTLLSISWMFATYLGYFYIKKRNFLKHANWLLRSYALTLSAVTLRFYAYIFDILNLSVGPVETYILLAYISWIPNLIVAEIMIRAGYTKRLIRYV